MRLAGKQLRWQRGAEKTGYYSQQQNNPDPNSNNDVVFVKVFFLSHIMDCILVEVIAPVRMAISVHQ